jgi:hypothetical protein
MGKRRVNSQFSTASSCQQPVRVCAVRHLVGENETERMSKRWREREGEGYGGIEENQCKNERTTRMYALESKLTMLIFL